MPSRAYAVEHDTFYEYGAAVATSQHVACLRPRRLPSQRLRWHEIDVEPETSARVVRMDYFGNTTEHFTVLGPHRELVVRARSLVEVDEPAVVVDPQSTPSWEEAREAFVYCKGARGNREAEFVFPSPCVSVGATSRDYGAPSFAEGRPVLDAAVDLMHRIHSDFVFDADATTVTTPVSRVLADRRGVCQDLAHVMISCLRSFGVAARYVSGYVLTDPPPGEDRLLGADASHAWVSVFCGAAGWVDLDPTNDAIPDARHVVIGWGRDYGDVCPLRGVFVGGGGHRLDVAVSVIPLDAVEFRRALARVTTEPFLDLGN